MSGPEALTFVYNADGGLLAGARDVAHKVFRPSTYPCRLCDLTYGAAGKKRSRKEYLEALAIPSSFLHRDEFRREHPEHAATPLPAVFGRRPDGKLDVVISADELRDTESLDALQARVDRVVRGDDAN